MADIHGAARTFEQLKAALQAQQLSECQRLLGKLKVSLTAFPALPPMFERTATAEQELLLAREILEYAVLLSVRQKDVVTFERNFLQLKTYYTDTKHMIPASPRELEIVGLNLLRLLTQKRIAEFHTELELLSPEDLSNVCVNFAVQMERWLMEGAYNNILKGGNSMPVESYAYFVGELATTVRDEIASCSERAYQHLKVDHAQKLMMFASRAELLEYARKHDWTIKDDTIHFQPEVDATLKEVPTMQLIRNTLMYARELERIV